MAVDNLAFWKQVKLPPGWATKTITGGRLSGKTDINPQWRLQALTERFGMVGFGWYTQVVDRWTEAGSDGQVMAFVTVELFVKGDDGEWSKPIEGTGGNRLIDKESRGLYSNDEAFKMCETDAISVACKKLGLGADIYAGAWDGSKYVKNTDSTLTDPEEEPKPKAARTSRTKAKAGPEPSAADLVPASEAEVEAYYAYVVEKGADSVRVGEHLENARKKYDGIIPKPWLEHLMMLAKQKYEKQS